MPCVTSCLLGLDVKRALRFEGIKEQSQSVMRQMERQC